MKINIFLSPPFPPTIISPPLPIPNPLPLQETPTPLPIKSSILFPPFVLCLYFIPHLPIYHYTPVPLNYTPFTSPTLFALLYSSTPPRNPTLTKYFPFPTLSSYHNLLTQCHYPLLIPNPLPLQETHPSPHKILNIVPLLCFMPLLHTPSTNLPLYSRASKLYPLYISNPICFTLLLYPSSKPHPDQIFSFPHPVSLRLIDT